MSERRQNFHQTVVGANLSQSSNLFQSAVQQMTSYLQVHGYSYADASNAAYLHYYNQLEAQTRMLAFMDCFRILGIVTLIVAPLIFLTKKFGNGGKAPAGH